MKRIKKNKLNKKLEFFENLGNGIMKNCAKDEGMVKNYSREIGSIR